MPANMPLYGYMNNCFADKYQYWNIAQDIGN